MNKTQQPWAIIVTCLPRQESARVDNALSTSDQARSASSLDTQGMTWQGWASGVGYLPAKPCSRSPQAVKVNSLGKWKTALQMVSMSVLMVVRQPPGDMGWLLPPFMVGECDAMLMHGDCVRVCEMRVRWLTCGLRHGLWWVGLWLGG